MKVFKKPFPYKFIVFAGLLLLTIFIIENINKRFWLNDFKVYYSAAQAFLNHTPVYGVAFTLGSGYYKYSPFVMLMVVPFCLFSFKTACIIQYFILSFSILTMFIIIFNLVNSYLFNNKIKNINLLLSIAFVCIINHLVRELHLGNINVVLLLLLSLSLLFILQSRFLLAGILLAIVIITKPFFILITLPLMFRKYFKTIFYLFITIIIFIIIPSVFIGFSGNLALHKEWINTMLEHNTSFQSNNTIENLIRIYINPDITPTIQYFILSIVIIAFVIFYLINRKNEIKDNRHENFNATSFIMEWFLLIAIIPNLFKTDTQHFLLSLPLIIIFIGYLMSVKNRLITICFIILMIIYGGNSTDLLGKTLSSRMDTIGVLGLSNILLIGFTIYIYFKSIQKRSNQRLPG